MALKFTVPLVASRFLNPVHITPSLLVRLPDCHPTVWGLLSIFVIVQPENVYHVLVGFTTSNIWSYIAEAGVLV